MPEKDHRRLRVVPDSNVLLSAVLFGGKPKEALDLALRGRVTLIVCPAILAEVEAVLCGKKFRFSKQAARAVSQEIAALAEVAEPAAVPSMVREDPDDDQVIACAIAGEADRLVTGDRHLLKLGTCAGVPIVNPDDFMKTIGD